jgi:hypothetical protein
MTPTIIKRAVWKHPQRPDREFLLARVERACFRWLDALTTKPWDGVDYLDTGTALKAMRVYVGGDPIMVGYDLTIFDVAPPPEERAAKRIGQAFNAGMTFDEYRSRCVEIIGQETNISPAVQAFSELIAYLMIHRAAFAAPYSRYAGRPAPRPGYGRATLHRHRSPGQVHRPGLFQPAQAAQRAGIQDCTSPRGPATARGKG